MAHCAILSAMKRRLRKIPHPPLIKGGQERQRFYSPLLQRGDGGDLDSEWHNLLESRRHRVTAFDERLSR
jgi:hypothetical protein